MSPAGFLVLLIRGYQRFVSPLLGPRCRFVPSCSAYAVEALQQHGTLRGIGLTGWRLVRCQPFCRGGYDPVPPPRGRRARQAAQPIGAAGSGAGPGVAPPPASSGAGPPSPAGGANVRPVPGTLARPARKRRRVRHNEAHGGEADGGGRAVVATAEWGAGADAAPHPPGRGDGTC